MTARQTPSLDTSAAGLTLEVWADVVCAWCYVGIRRLRRALEHFPYREHVRLQLRSFELEPEFHETSGARTVVDLLIAQGLYANRDSASRRFRYVTEAGAEEGLELCTALARPTCSFDAHRLVHFAAEHSREQSLLERLMCAYHIDNRDLGESQTLVAIAAQEGFASAETRAVLDSDSYATQVRADEQRAADLGVRTIPAFHIRGHHLVEGVPTAAEMKALLRRALHGQSRSAPPTDTFPAEAG